MTHFKILKRILQYIKVTNDFSLFYDYSNCFELVNYNDSDWTEDMDDKNSNTGFVFYMEDIIHMKFKEAIHGYFVNMWTWICSYHIMCLSFHTVKEIIEGIVNDTRETYWNLYGQLISHCINNPLFHDRSKHIDTRFHYLWDCIANKKVEVKYVKI